MPQQVPQATIPSLRVPALRPATEKLLTLPICGMSGASNFCSYSKVGTIAVGRSSLIFSQFRLQACTAAKTFHGIKSCTPSIVPCPNCYDIRCVQRAFISCQQRLLTLTNTTDYSATSIRRTWMDQNCCGIWSEQFQV